jgi:hypothetical protein
MPGTPENRAEYPLTYNQVPGSNFALSLRSHPDPERKTHPTEKMPPGVSALSAHGNGERPYV